MAAAAVAARSAAAVASRAAAVRHVASGTGRFSLLFPRRGLGAGTTTTTLLPAACTRSMPYHGAAATALGTRLLQRGLSTTPDDGLMDHIPLCWVDPEAPIDPATTCTPAEEDMASEEAMWALHERWCAFHDVKRDRDDMLRRFGFFKDKARSIHEFNQSGASYTKLLNKRADHTPEERANFVLRGRCF